MADTDEPAEPEHQRETHTLNHTYFNVILYCQLSPVDPCTVIIFVYCQVAPQVTGVTMLKPFYKLTSKVVVMEIKRSLRDD